MAVANGFSEDHDVHGARLGTMDGSALIHASKAKDK